MTVEIYVVVGAILSVAFVAYGLGYYVASKSAQDELDAAEDAMDELETKYNKLYGAYISMMPLGGEGKMG